MSGIALLVWGLGGLELEWIRQRERNFVIHGNKVLSDIILCCHIISQYLIVYYFISYQIISSYIISYCIIYTYYNISYHVLYHIKYCITFIENLYVFHHTYCNILSYHITRHHIISYLKAPTQTTHWSHTLDKSIGCLALSHRFDMNHPKTLTCWVWSGWIMILFPTRISIK